MRTDENHIDRHNSFLNIIKNKKKIDLLFLGDSLTRRWEEVPDLWNSYFSIYNPTNFGIGGDTIQNLKWRILNGEIDNIDPKILILLIGTNNLPINNEEEIKIALTDIINILSNKLKNSIIILNAILPRNIDETKKNYMKMIKNINNYLKKISLKNEKIIYFDIGEEFLEKKNIVKINLMPDGLHLNKDGYVIMGTHLLKIIEKNWK